MKYQNSLNNPCSNCNKKDCRGCDYLLDLKFEYGLNSSDAKDVRDYISETGENEEDAVNLIAKKGLKGILMR